MSATNLSLSNKKFKCWSDIANDVKFQMTPNMNMSCLDHFDFSNRSYNFEIIVFIIVVQKHCEKNELIFEFHC